MATFLLYCLSVLLIHLSFPGGPAPLLVWAAFAPFAAALARSKGPGGFILSGFYALGFWYCSTWWFAAGLKNIAEFEYSSAVLITIISSAIGAAPYLAFSALAMLFKTFDPCRRPVLAASLLTLLVFLFPNYFPGTPAHALYRYPVLLQICAAGGIALLFFFVALSSFFLAAAFEHEKKRWFHAAAAAGVPLTVWLYGLVSLSRYEELQKTFPRQKIGLVQPNVSLRGQDFPDESSAGYLETPLRLTRELAAKNPDLKLIVWPELPRAFSFSNQKYDYEWVRDLTAGLSAPLLLSDFKYEAAENSAPRYFNTMHLLRGSNAEPEEYRKNILIPFGEYVPYENHLPAGWRKLLESVRRYTPGTEAVPFKIDGLNAAPAVCLEAIYPSFVAHLARQGANVLVNPANDAYFGETPGPYVHLALSVMRAIEFRMPLIRVTNSGVSQIVLPSGKFLLPEQPLFSEGAWAAEIAVPPLAAQTNPNNATIIFCACIIALLAALGRHEKRP